MQPKLGILAGGGRLPADIINICQRTGRAFYVIAFEGQADDGLCDNIAHSGIRLGAAGRTLDTLRENGVEEIIFVGSIDRPTLGQLRPDIWGVKFLARSGAMALGDDGLLSVLVRTLEQEEGFRVVGVGDVAQELLAPMGAIGSIRPSDADHADIKIAVAAALDLGAKDLGQAAIARGGDVVGLEDSMGTDALLHRTTALSGPGQPQDTRNVPGDAHGNAHEGVLAKVAKPQQERRVDLPTIGMKTLENAAQAGLAGIVVEAGATIILEQYEIAERADKLGLFVVGIHTEDILDHE